MGDMADNVEQPELEITFRGRKIWVHMPSPEQLLVWRRTLTNLQSGEAQGWNAEQSMRALERARMIIDSTLANAADTEWLDDQMLAGGLTLVEAAEIIQKTVDAFVDAAASEGNREERRSAKKSPAKKAVRKAPKKG